MSDEISIRYQIVLPEQVTGQTFKVFRDVGLREVTIYGTAILIIFIVLIFPGNLIPKLVIGALTATSAFLLAQFRRRGYTIEQLIIIYFVSLLTPKVYIHQTAYPEISSIPVPVPPTKVEDDSSKKKQPPKQDKEKEDKSQKVVAQRVPKRTQSSPSVRLPRIPALDNDAGAIVVTAVILVAILSTAYVILNNYERYNITLPSFLP